MAKYLLVKCDNDTTVNWMATRMAEILRYSNRNPQLLGNVGDDEVAYDMWEFVSKHPELVTAFQCDVKDE